MCMFVWCVCFLQGREGCYRSSEQINTEFLEKAVTTQTDDSIVSSGPSLMY